MILSPILVNLTKSTPILSVPRDYISKILNMRYDSNKAIVRYCLGRLAVNENLEKFLIEKIKITKKDYHISRYVKYIIEEQDTLKEFGIEIRPMVTNKKLLGIFRKVNKKDERIRIYRAGNKQIFADKSKEKQQN